MTRIILIAMALTLLAACGGSDDNNNPTVKAPEVIKPNSATPLTESDMELYDFLLHKEGPKFFFNVKDPMQNQYLDKRFAPITDLSDLNRSSYSFVPSFSNTAYRVKNCHKNSPVISNNSYKKFTSSDITALNYYSVLPCNLKNSVSSIEFDEYSFLDKEDHNINYDLYGIGVLSHSNELLSSTPLESTESVYTTEKFISLGNGSFYNEATYKSINTKVISLFQAYRDLEATGRILLKETSLIVSERNAQEMPFLTAPNFDKAKFLKEFGNPRGKTKGQKSFWYLEEI